MHKSYYTVSPCQSKYLQKQFDEAAQEKHLLELQRAKATVDSNPPKTYMHLHLKPKKLQMEAERLATVEHENRLLLEKMSHIMKTGGGIDNRNNYVAQSLNTKKRQREHMDMTRENKMLMERVLHSSRDSELSNWQQDWQRNLERMDRISRFPNSWWEGSQSQRSPRKAAQPGGSESSRSQQQPQQQQQKQDGTGE